ncbi:hypothetical protein Droror1_Dr00005674 [Drosera rotundifolia]
MYFDSVDLRSTATSSLCLRSFKISTFVEKKKSNLNLMGHMLNPTSSMSQTQHSLDSSTTPPTPDYNLNEKSSSTDTVAQVLNVELITEGPLASDELIPRLKCQIH